MLQIYIELAEKILQSGLQIVSLLTNFKDVLQSQIDDLQKKGVSLKSLVSENYSTSIPLCVSSELPEVKAGSISSHQLVGSSLGSRSNSCLNETASIYLKDAAGQQSERSEHKLDSEQGGAHGERWKFLERQESRKKLHWLQQREVLEVPQKGNLGK